MESTEKCLKFILYPILSYIICLVMSSGGQSLYRVPQFNMVSFGLENAPRGGDLGTVWTIPTYTKYYESSGLQIMLSANSKGWSTDDTTTYDPCCRHYFVINGEECADPGPIEGITSLNKPTLVFRSNMIEGICEGISAGAVTLTLDVGICRGHTKKGDCMLGYKESIQLLVSEAFVDRDILQY